MARTINESVERAILRMYEDGVAMVDIEKLLNITYRDIIIIVWSYKIGKTDERYK